MSVQRVSGTGSIASPRAAEGRPAADGGLGAFLAAALDTVQARVADAERLAAAQAAGEAVPLHEVMLAQQEARLALQTAVTLRNAALDAYREILRLSETG